MCNANHRHSGLCVRDRDRQLLRSARVKVTSRHFDLRDWCCRPCPFFCLRLCIRRHPTAKIAMDVHAEPRPSPPRPAFWVEVPKPPPLGSRTNVYRTIDYTGPRELVGDSSEEDVSSDEEDPSDLDSLELQEIVGEHTWPNGKAYFYARLRSEVIRKASVSSLSRRF